VNDAPLEPSADHREFAYMCRQMFIALVSQGFTEAQALAVIGHMIAGGQGR